MTRFKTVIRECKNDTFVFNGRSLVRIVLKLGGQGQKEGGICRLAELRSSFSLIAMLLFVEASSTRVIQTTIVEVSSCEGG